MSKRKELTDVLKGLQELDSHLSKVEIEARHDAQKEMTNVIVHNYEEGKATAYDLARREIHRLFPKAFPEYQKP